LHTFGRYSEASEQFRRVITIQPDNFQGYSNLGAMYYLLGLYKDAVAMYERAIEIYPNADSYTNLGTVYFYLERYEEAITAYICAIKLNPHDDVLYLNLGDAYLRIGKHQDAEAQFKLAGNLLEDYLTINPSNAKA